jgi:hypothetical protein
MMARVCQRFRSLLVIPVIGAVAVSGWFYWQTTKPTGMVTARIVLDRGVCRSLLHDSDCRRLAQGGVVVIFGPVTNTGGSPETHEVTLHSANQRIAFRLPPGSYDLGLWIEPPYQALLPSFGTHGSGNFVVRADRTTNLGVVQPGADWVVTES